MAIKTITTHFKMLGRGEKAANGQAAETSGQWEAIVSVFDNVDMYGDKVKPGAFKDTLEEWARSGDPIPVYYSHRMDDPTMLIGHSLDAAEVKAKDGLPAGLWTLSQADLDNPTAAQVFKSMENRLLRESSFSYNVEEEKYVPPEDEEADPWETGDFGHFELIKLKLFEYGPTPVGANPDTVLIGTKAGTRLAVPRRTLASATKAGKILSSKNASALQEAYDIIGRVLSESEPADDEQAKSEEPVGSRSKQPGNDVERWAALTELLSLPTLS